VKNVAVKKSAFKQNNSEVDKAAQAGKLIMCCWRVCLQSTVNSNDAQSKQMIAMVFCFLVLSFLYF
jgi:phage FluMu gp28-like protein